MDGDWEKSRRGKERCWNDYPLLTPKDPHSIKHPPVYSNDSFSTLVGSAYERKINDVGPIKEKVDTADRLEDIRKLMAKDKLDY